MNVLGNILKERANTHGSFAEVSSIAQSIKFIMRSHDAWGDLTDDKKETLDLIASKIGRALSGNSNEIDHWQDIAGYATLIVMDLSNHKD